MSAALDTAPPRRLAPGGRAAAIFAVLAAMAMVVLDAGITNVALPVLGPALGLSAAQSILPVTAYQAGLVMALLPAGALGERYGYRRVFGTGVSLFALASIACALSPSAPWLVSARLVQGLGAAAVMALGVALLRQAVGPGRLGAAIGWNAMTVALASAAAPSLGALLLSVTGWRGLFVLGLPVATAVLVALRVLPDSPERTGRPDFIGMVLNAVGFGLLILAAELAVGAPRLAGLLLAIGAGVLAALLRRETVRPDPLIPLDLLRLRPFRLSVLASVCCFAGQTAGLVALPFLLQQGLGQTPLVAGLYLTLWPMGVAVAALAAGRLADRLSASWLCAAGGLVLAIGLAGAALWPLERGAGGLIPFIVLAGMGFGLFQTPNNRTLFLSAPAGRSGAAGGLQGSARVSGQTAGGLAITLLFGQVAAGTAPSVGLGLAAALALAAAVVSLLRSRT